MHAAAEDGDCSGRWRVLPLICLLCLGTNFIYDFPGSLGMGSGDTIEARFLLHNASYTQAMNQGLYAAYSFPNTVLVVVGGALIDTYLGLRKATVLFAAVAVCGSATFYLGVYFIRYPLLVAGRVLLGCGCECLGIAQSAWSTTYFADHSATPIAFATSVALQRIGGGLNFLFSVEIANRLGVCAAVAVGIGAVGLSGLVAVTLLILDSWVRQAVVQDPSSSTPKPLVRKVNLRDVWRLPYLVWVLAAVCGSIYSSLLPFLGFAVQFFEVRFRQPAVAASRTVSLYLFAVSLGCPVAGFVVSRLAGGRRASIGVLLLASATLSLGLASFAFVPADAPPAALIPLLAASFCFVSATLFPTVPKVVEPQLLGTAFGVLTAVIAFTGAVMRIVVGLILDGDDDKMGNNGRSLPEEGSFTMLLWILVGLAGGAVLGCVAFLAKDWLMVRKAAQAAATTLGTEPGHSDERQALLN